MTSPSVSDLCATIREQADRVALIVTAQATEIAALQRKVVALTVELHDVRTERDRMRSALARWHIDQHKGAA